MQDSLSFKDFNQQIELGFFDSTFVRALELDDSIGSLQVHNQHLTVTDTDEVRMETVDVEVELEEYEPGLHIIKDTSQVFLRGNVNGSFKQSFVRIMFTPCPQVTPPRSDCKPNEEIKAWIHDASLRIKINSNFINMDQVDDGDQTL